MFGAYNQPSAIMKEWTEKPTVFLNSDIHGPGAKTIFKLVKLGFAYTTGSKIDDCRPDKASELCEA